MIWPATASVQEACSWLTPRHHPPCLSWGACSACCFHRLAPCMRRRRYSASPPRPTQDRWHDAHDNDTSGTVDVKELIEGLEGQLRKDFIKRMTKTMKRKPSPAEVDERISEMPGGSLLPMEVGAATVLNELRRDGVVLSTSVRHVF